MGGCLSCCNPDENKDNVNGNPQTQPLINPVTEGGSSGSMPGYGSTVDRTQPKGDDQSDLTRILHQTADDVIDVGALDSQAMDQLEYMDRARLYSQRLAEARGANRTTRKHPRLPAGVAAPHIVLTTQPVSLADVHLISTAAQTASRAVKDVKVKHKEDLVVPFGVP